MPDIREFEPILPDPEPYLKKALELYEEHCVRRKLGRVVFIEGEPGGGKTELLGAIGKAIHQAKPSATFITGYFSRGEYRPYTFRWREPICLRRAAVAVGGLGSLLGFLPIQYAVALSLIGQAIEAFFGAQEFASEFSKEPQEREQQAEHLKIKLRRAAEEKPTIVLLDDWEESQRYHWDLMLLSFAREIAYNLPILIFVTVKGPINLHRPEEDGPSEAIKSLTEEGLAELWKLNKLSLEDVAGLIGPSVPSIANRLHRVTGGNAGWVREVWREWKVNEIVIINDQDRWLWNPRVSSEANLYGDILESRLKRILKRHLITEVEQVRKVLACAALEGVQFTGEAVARALNWNRDELIDLLDQLVQSDQNPDGILIEDGFISIPDGDPPTLWLYRFVSDLYWFVLDRFGFANEPRPDRRDTERNEVRRALIQGLIDVYQTEDRLVAGPLARLLRAEGNLAAANHYQQQAIHAASRTMMRNHALYVLSINKTNLERWQISRTYRFLLAAGWSMWSFFPYSETLSVFDEAVNLARYAKDPYAEGMAQYGCGLVLKEAGRYVDARERATRFLVIEQEIGNRQGQAVSLFLLAQIDHDEGKYGDARERALQSLMIDQEIGNRRGEAACLYLMAQLDYLESQNGDARARTERSLAIVRKIGDRQNESSCLYLLAQIDYDEGKYGDARERALRSLMIDQEIGNRRGEAACLLLLAQIDYLEGKNGDARPRAQQSLAIDQEIGYRHGEGLSLHLLAQIDHDEGRYGDARERALQSAAISRELGNRQGEAAGLLLRAQIDLDENKCAEARALAVQSLAIDLEIGARQAEADCLLLLAQIDRNENKWADARERAVRSLALARETGSRRGEAASLHLLAHIDLDEGKKQDAREHAAQAAEIFHDISGQHEEVACVDLLAQIDRDED